MENKDYTPSDTPMGKAMIIAIKIAEKPAPPKGPKPKDAAKLPEGWHYMPDGKVMSNAECDGEHGCMHGQESEDEGED